MMKISYVRESVALQVIEAAPPRVFDVDTLSNDKAYVLFQTWPFMGYGLTPNAKNYIHGKVLFSVFRDTIHPMLEAQGFNVFWVVEN